MRGVILIPSTVSAPTSRNCSVVIYLTASPGPKSLNPSKTEFAGISPPDSPSSWDSTKITCRTRRHLMRQDLFRVHSVAARVFPTMSSVSIVFLDAPSVFSKFRSTSQHPARNLVPRLVQSGSVVLTLWRVSLKTVSLRLQKIVQRKSLSLVLSVQYVGGSSVSYLLFPWIFHSVISLFTETSFFDVGFPRPLRNSDFRPCVLACLTMVHRIHRI
ncbi:hypothetical protein C8R47DRAFT_791027 [Mycena vitilis]|nr:hypothetical protein C8R47DRAFT_791027 [Mycena vitilis]